MVKNLKEMGMPKPCRALRAAGKCPSPDVRCAFPLGRTTKCFAAFENDDGSLPELLDMTLELHNEKSADGKADVPVFSRRYW